MTRLAKSLFVCFLTTVVLAGAVFVFYGNLSQINKTEFVSTVKAAGFICGTDTVTDIDDNIYNTVQIGTQCWLKENLITGTRINGGINQINNAPTNIIEKYCDGDTDAGCDDGVTNWGGLYQWDEAMNYSIVEGAQGICPVGFHIPTDAQQYILENYLKDVASSCNGARVGLGDCISAGEKLKVGGSSDFNGILAGYRHASGLFVSRGPGGGAFFWSSSENGANAWGRRLDSGLSSVYRWAYDKALGFSVRCVSDTASGFVPVTANVMGFAWSENIGWVSFNNQNCDTDNNGFSDAASPPCPAAGTYIQGYGVNLNFGTGNLSGYAWSENIGWVSFNAADVAGCPAGTCQPRYNSGTGEFLGWARALANGGGWDGWIKLRKDPFVAPAYGVNLNGTDFEGFAWGDMVVGWVSFNSKNCDSAAPIGQSDGGLGCPAAGTPMSAYKVYLGNNPPTVSGLTTNKDSINYCSSSFLSINLNWIFADTEDANQTFYKVKITRSDGIVYNPGIVNNVNTVVNGSYIQGILPGFLRYDSSGTETYSWEVTVYDSAGASAGPVSGPNFSFPRHMYPTADFICSPSTTSCPVNHSQFEPISFTDKSICYDNNNNSTPCASRSWSFGDGSPLSSLPNPKHTYTAQGIYPLVFTVTDPSPSSFTCTKNNSINIGAVSPKWKEVIPK